jgi:response regulator of citrate/malate metabolism
MPTNRITMRQIRETLRLHLAAGLSFNEVGRNLKISKSAAAKYASLARAAGVDWELAHRGSTVQGSKSPSSPMKSRT